MKALLVSIAVLSVALMSGCSGGTDTAGAGTTGSSTTVAMAKCAGCGKEFPAAELADHDGAKMCKACIAAHNH